MGFFKNNKRDKTADIERMIDEYGDDVLRTAYIYLKDTQRAEDAFQEVFIKVLKNYDKFNGDCSEKTWIIRITINICKDIIKSFWAQKVTAGDEYIENVIEEGIENKVIDRIESEILYKQILNLPEKYKEVIFLYYYHSYNTIETGKILDIPEGTVRSRLARARDILKKQIIGRSGAIE